MAKRIPNQAIKKPEPVRVSVTFDRRDYAELQIIADEKRVSTAWVVRDAVAAYLGDRSPLFKRDSGGELSR